MATAKQKFQIAYRAVRVAGRHKTLRGEYAIGRQFAGWITKDGDLIESCECDNTPAGASEFQGFVFSETFLSKVQRGGFRQAALQSFAARLWNFENSQTTPAQRLSTQVYEYA